MRSTEPTPMTIADVQAVVLALRQWEGAQLQEVVIEGTKGQPPRAMHLGFYRSGGMLWLIFDYLVRAPMLVLFERKPPAATGKLRRPIELFLRSKHVGRRLRAVQFDPAEGRCLTLLFDQGVGGEEAALEFKIFPHGRNVTARFGDSAISEFKPAAESKAPTAVVQHETASAARDVQQMAAEWAERRQVGSRVATTFKAAAPAESPRLKKKQQALAKVEAELLAKQQAPFRQIGEWIKAEQSLAVPEVWREHVRGDESLAANIERLFALAKSGERKIHGTRERIAALRQEISQLENAGEQPAAARKAAGPALPTDMFSKIKARGRKHQLADDLILYIGKSASDNLALLRAAQPFDLWLHLREQPGSHGILRRTRGRTVTDEELFRAGVYVAEQSMKQRANDLRGESFDLLIVECRYVKPIKGDRLGRVNYTHDRVLRLKF